MSLGRRLFWPTLTTLMMVGLAAGLGSWQVRRLHWKQDLLAQIDAAEAAGPVPITPNPPPFRRVVVDGQFKPGLSARYGVEVRGGRMGSQLLAVLLPVNGAAVVVDRGWAPAEFGADPPAGPVQIEGYVRPPEHAGWASAQDDVAGRRFYTLDPVLIGSALGVPGVQPFTLVALGAAGQLPEPAARLPRPPNDHLTYAITWFFLGAVLLIVFAVYVRRTIRA